MFSVVQVSFMSGWMLVKYGFPRFSRHYCNDVNNKEDHVFLLGSKQLQINSFCSLLFFNLFQLAVKTQTYCSRNKLQCMVRLVAY